MGDPAGGGVSIWEVLTAIGTIGAAGAAAWAAWTSRGAANAAADLVRIESERDQRAEREDLWRQARRVVLDLSAQDMDLPAGKAIDVRLVIWNTSDDPILFCRYRITSGSVGYGPQLLGTVGPHQQVVFTARIYDGSRGDLTCLVRFRDVHGRYWMVNEINEVTPDDDSSTDSWIAEGQRFAERDLRPEERGAITGYRHPSLDLDGWRADLDE